MLDGLLLGNAVDGVEMLVRHVGTVRLERVQLRDVPAQEDFQRTQIHEPCGVRDNAGKEAVILLVTTQLGLPVSVAGNHDRLQALHVAQHVHVGIEAELPLAVLHGAGDDDREGEVHLAVPFRDVAETGRNLGGVQGFGRHHVSGFFVPDGFHQQEFPSVVILDPEGVAQDFRLLDFRNVRVPAQDQGRRGIAPLDGGQLPLRTAGSGQREGRQGPDE